MSKQITRQQTKQERRREEQRRQEEARRRAARTRRFVIIGVVAALVLAIGATAYYYIVAAPAQKQASTSSTADSTQPGATVNGVGCDQQEQNLLHTHSHLAIYINGQSVPLPANIGIESDNSCLYWLHTHDTTGVIHVESPQNRQFTLGNFFDVWGKQFQQLQYPPELNQTDGWVVYVNGKPYNGNFRNILLAPHTLITLAFQSPNAKPDTTYNWGTL